MKYRLLAQVLAGAVTSLGVIGGVTWLLAAVRGAVVAAVETSTAEAALLAIAAGMYAVILLIPFALALGGWLVLGAVWTTGRLARLVGCCLRRRDTNAVYLPVAARDHASQRAA